MAERSTMTPERRAELLEQYEYEIHNKGFVRMEAEHAAELFAAADMTAMVDQTSRAIAIASAMCNVDARELWHAVARHLDLVARAEAADGDRALLRELLDVLEDRTAGASVVGHVIGRARARVPR